MSDRNGCVQFLDSMCPIFDNMHRYTTLIWDSNKKTLLGKNGVSWLSILLGTFVVILGLSVFIQCVREVKKSRQESDTQMRKLLLEKIQLSAARAGTSTVKNVTHYPEVISNNIISPAVKNISIDIPSDETGDFEFLKEHGLLVRRKRNFPVLHGIIRTPSYYKKTILRQIVKEPNNTIILKRGEHTERSEHPKNDAKGKINFLEKLASARYERLKKHSSISDTLENVFPKKADSSFQIRKSARFNRFCVSFRKYFSNDSVFRLLKSVNEENLRKRPLVGTEEENAKIIPNFEGKCKMLKKDFLKSNILSKHFDKYKKNKLSKLLNKFVVYRRTAYRSSNIDKYKQPKPNSVTEQNKKFEQDSQQFFVSTNNKNDDPKNKNETLDKTLDKMKYSKYIMNEDENSGILIRRRY